MNYDLNKPCGNCPFRRDGGIRLRCARAEDIAELMLGSAGGEFPCHKTTVEDDDGCRRSHTESQHCAGALIFAEKNGSQTQMMRIAHRLGMYDPQALMADRTVVDAVFDDAEEMIEAQGDA